MPPVVLDMRNTDDDRDVVHRAVQALAEGKLVGLPSEAVYGVVAGAMCESAVAQLADERGGGERGGEQEAGGEGEATDHLRLS